MLNAGQAEACRDLLRHASSIDIRSLCETVTNRYVVPESNSEAVQAIVQYSKSPEELLGRRKVKVEVLFKYLQSIGMPGVSVKSSKAELMTKILNYWKSSKTDIVKVSKKPASQPSHTTYNVTQVFKYEVHNHAGTAKEEHNGQKMATEFIKWYYPMLNNLKDSTKGLWGPKHFWPDVVLHYGAMTDSGESFGEKCDGSQAVCRKLSSLITDEKVIFNPNVTQEGFRGVISPHGLAKVAVCGSLHKYDSGQPASLDGVFEQVFGLLRDISDGNRWKIKQCQLKIRAAGSHWRPGRLALTDETIKSLQFS